MTQVVEVQVIKTDAPSRFIPSSMKNRTTQGTATSPQKDKTRVPTVGIAREMFLNLAHEEGRQ